MIISDNETVCRVHSSHCWSESNVPERACEPPAQQAADGGGELHLAHGGRVSSAQRTTYLPNQQLRHDARRDHGENVTLVTCRSA